MVTAEQLASMEADSHDVLFMVGLDTLGVIVDDMEQRMVDPKANLERYPRKRARYQAALDLARAVYDYRR